MTGLEVALRPPPVAETVKPRSSALFPKITLTRLIRSNYLRNLHGLVLAGHYFWVQNLGSSVREQSAVWNKEHKEVHSCTTQGDYISDGERVTVKIKVDGRKQLFLGRALMKVWRLTSRIGEDGSLTYSNHRHSQVTVISICISEYDGERVTVKTKVDRRKQLLLGRALMKVWRWTSRIGEDGSMTYSNYSISTDKTAETLARHRQTRLNVLATRKNKNTEQISAP